MKAIACGPEHGQGVEGRLRPGSLALLLLVSSPKYLGVLLGAFPGPRGDEGFPQPPRPDRSVVKQEVVERAACVVNDEVRGVVLKGLCGIGDGLVDDA